MAHLTYDAPLQWPENQPATPRARLRADSGFSPSMTLDEAVRFLTEEVNALDPQQAVLSTDIVNIATPRNRQALGSRTGAALSIKLQGRVYSFACDRWEKLEHNLYVLHLTLRQLRNMEKWGVASLADLLEPFSTRREKTVSHAETVSASVQETAETADWMRILGLGSTATLEDAVAVYHRRAKRISSDSDALQSLNEAMNEARKHLRGE